MISENFDVRELVHPNIYNHPNIGDRCADWLHINLAPTLEAIRANFVEVITVNDWHRGGIFKSSGLRDRRDPVGGEYSSHYHGVAADCKFKRNTPKQIFDEIMKNQKKYPFITRIENINATPSWLHIEVGRGRIGNIIVFSP